MPAVPSGPVTWRTPPSNAVERLAIGHEHDRRRDERAGDLRGDVRRTLLHGKRRCTASASVTAGFRCAPVTPAAT